MATSRKPPQARKTTPDLAREIAYDVIREVHESDAYANLLLPAKLRDLRERTHRTPRAEQQGFSDRDAAFATELVYGTLRMRGLLDAVLAACVDRPLEQLDPAVLDLLRLGAYQLLEMRVPSHAAVAATVNLARRVSTAGPAGLVNAVLRKVAANDRDQWIAIVAPPMETDPLGHLSIAGSHPRWIVTAFRDALGSGSVLAAESWDRTAELIDANNVRPTVTLVARPGLSTPAELLAIPGRSPGRWSPYAVLLESGAPWTIAQIRDGRAGVQDEGSQLVALALSRVALEPVKSVNVESADVERAANEQWLDLCAGPGGKAALLAGLAQECGARLTANEVHDHRAQLVRQALSLYGPDHHVVTSDAAAPGDGKWRMAWEPASFDRVLVDAPCTGLGSLRRRPESRWRRTPADLATLGPLQRALLRTAFESVRPGGVVAYVTCSPHIAETDLVVNDVIRERGDVVRLDARATLPEVDDLGTGPDVRLWPHIHGTDAMYLALLRRT